MGTSNFIDRNIIKLSELWDGWGMLLYVLVTLSISATLACLIGLERYKKGENAGMRTHALLTVGCSFLMTISIWAIRIPDPTLDYDISRIASGAITGIGFLGAGVIIKDKFTVKGLSTAATLWICSAVGLATGAGFVLEAIIATVITMLIVFIRNKIIVTVDRNAPHLSVKSKSDISLIEVIKEACYKNDINLKNIEITNIEGDEITAKAYFPYRINSLLLEYLKIELKKNESVIEVNLIQKKKNSNHTPHES